MSNQTALEPGRIFQTIHAYQSSAAMKGALELGLFTALGAESKTAASLASAVGASERGVRILCDFLVVGELLEKQGDEYRSPPDVALFLDESSPAYVGSVGKFMLGSDVGSRPWRGGTLVPWPLVQVIPLRTDGDGAAEVAIAAWPEMPPGVRLVFQVWVVDEEGPVGLSATDGLVVGTH